MRVAYFAVLPTPSPPRTHARPQANADRDEAVGKATKWQRIRTPDHGPCCTCQACGEYYDSCRCDLDDVADDLAQARTQLAAQRAELELINDLRNRASDALDVCAAERDKWKGYYKRFGGCLMSCANCDVDMCGQEEIIEAGAAIFCCTQCAKDALL